MMIYKFYDTSSLLLKVDTLFKDDESFVISTVTLAELENLKTSLSKNPEIKSAVRKLIRLLSENKDKYEVWPFTMGMLDPIIKKDLPINEDAKILATAIDYDKNVHPDATVFVTNDLALYNIANLFFGEDSIEQVVEPKEEEYYGYKEVVMTDEEMSEFYSNQTNNFYNLYTNEYLIIKNESGEVVDTFCWTGIDYRHVGYKDFQSKLFGNVRAKKGDVHQLLFLDSLANNQITMVTGPAGTGKTFLSLAYMFHLLEKGTIDRIVVFCNTIATKGSAKLGFYPGTRDEKLLDSQIGNLLISKIGSRMVVEDMLREERLVLLPLSDIRGYDTSGMNAGIYVSEAQNMDIDLMKLTLQRIGEDSICIIDGDYNCQVDLEAFAGKNNGMKRASKIFRGHDIYGEVALTNIHRSKIAQIAEAL